MEPSSTVKLTLSTAVRPPKRLVTSCAQGMGSAGHGRTSGLAGFGNPPASCQINNALGEALRHIDHDDHQYGSNAITSKSSKRCNTWPSSVMAPAPAMEPQMLAMPPTTTMTTNCMENMNPTGPGLQT